MLCLIRCVAVKNEAVQKQMHEAIHRALDTPVAPGVSRAAPNVSVPSDARVPLTNVCLNNPFGKILSKTATKRKGLVSATSSKTPVKNNSKIMA